jgi:ribosomal-protein-alanine N-acetyltransferase
VTVGWPVVLRDGLVTLRPLRQRDAAAWRAVRLRNVEWLQAWEATVPNNVAEVPPTFAVMVRRLRVEAREGRALPFVIDYGGRLAGQLTIGGISWGSLRSAHVGYWIDSELAGRGVMPTAVALAVDHCFRELHLHRIEVAIRPENVRSQRVVAKLGFRFEGTRERFLHINGDWRDHLTYALTAEEVPDGLLARWHATQATVN